MRRMDFRRSQDAGAGKDRQINMSEIPDISI
jgi:hypothetical protein